MSQCFKNCFRLCLVGSVSHRGHESAFLISGGSAACPQICIRKPVYCLPELLKQCSSTCWIILLTSVGSLAPDAIPDRQLLLVAIFLACYVMLGQAGSFESRASLLENNLNFHIQLLSSFKPYYMALCWHRIMIALPNSFLPLLFIALNNCYFNF